MRPSLLSIAAQYGTPAYAYDLQALRNHIDRLLSAYPANQLRYSLKANPSLGLCRIIAATGFGADVSSIGELLIALKAGFLPSRICVSGPYKAPELLGILADLKEVTISVDSISELEQLAKLNRVFRVVLRVKLNADPGVDRGERFGLDIGDLARCRAYLGNLQFRGLHFYSKTQILCADSIIRNFKHCLGLAKRASEILGKEVELINFGAGLGVPYKIDECELDLDRLAIEMQRLSTRLSRATVVVELGRFVVAQAGWYLTSVVAHQRWGGLDAVVVDGGTHQKSDLCGVGLRTGARPPMVLCEGVRENRMTAILGCLCLPTDVLAESVNLPRLQIGDVLAFPNAGAYGALASPLNFLCHPEPAEVAFEGDRIMVLRKRTGVDAVLRHQCEPF